MTRLRLPIGIGFGIGAAALLAAPADAQAPLGTAFTYQGQLKLTAGGVADGLHDMRFRLFEANVLGTQVGPTLCMDGVDVVDGLFTAQLDFGSSPFAGDARWLDISLRADATIGNCVNGTFMQLTPRQPLTATPYATFATRAPWGGLTGVPAGFADGVDNTGALTLPFSGTFAGSDTTAFSLTQTGLGGAARFSNTNASNYYEALFAGSNGTGPAFYASHSGTGYSGQFQNTSASNGLPAVLAITNGSGACVYANPSVGSNGIGVIGIGRGTGDGMRASADGSGNAFEATSSGTGRAGFFESTNPNCPVTAVRVNTNSTMAGVGALAGVNTGRGPAGIFEINNSVNSDSAVLATTTGSGYGVEAINTGTGRAGHFEISNASSFGTTLYTRTNGRGIVGVFENTNALNVNDVVRASTNGNGDALYASTTGDGSALNAQTTGDSYAVRVNVNNASNTSPAMYVTTNGTGRAALFQLNNPASTNPGLQVSTQGLGPAIRASSGAGGVALEAFGNTITYGTATVRVLEITGADVAEKFPTSSERDSIKPGMVMEIDPDNAGKLRIAQGAYNRRVAGVVSGAGDIPTGTILGNLPGSEGAPPIALSGRVYVYCDASSGSIAPGDLLTTSDTLGHAMKVSDYPSAQGATIGKAMTGLKEGRGLVLVLVSLQ